jgi:hemerythrin-like domain-containing protein
MATQRSTARTTRHMSIKGYVTTDHGRLDSLLAQLARRVASGRLAGALATFRGLHAGFARHIRMEENVLFPLFEALTGIVGGATEAMRAEHRVHEGILQGMLEALEADDASAFLARYQSLQELVPPHRSKKENILYPVLDGVLPPDKRALVIERLERE